MKTDLIIGNIPISIHENPVDMGNAAADFVHLKLQEVFALKGSANLILATGSSQFTFLKALKQKEIDWKKIPVFEYGECSGISNTHPACFQRYIRERILDGVFPKKIYFLKGDAQDVEQEILKYPEELKKHPIDIACIG